MQKVYIVLTYTGTILSRMVKGYTKKEYSHISLALDEDLKQMYSFGRKSAYNPLNAGFVHESKDRGIFKRFNKTKTKIYSLQVNEEQFKKIKKVIDEFNNNQSSYRFNMLGVILAAWNLKLKREKHFYCAEFVKYVFETSDLEYNLPDVIKPNDFENINNLQEIYQGVLKEYNM